MRSPVRLVATLLALTLTAACNTGDDDGGGDDNPDDQQATDTGQIVDTSTPDIGPTTTEVWADQFDQSCSNDDQCVPVLVGDVCSCGCETGAVNKEMATSFQKARKRAAKNCSELPECDTCEAPTAVCKSGTCVIEGQSAPTPDTDGGGSDTGGASDAGADATSDADPTSDADETSDADTTSDAG